MSITVSHALSATTPDDPTAEVQPKHWNSAHLVTVSLLAAAEIVGAFSNANGISFGDSGGKVTGSYTVPTQSVQTQAAGNIAGIGFTSTSTAGVDIKATHGTDGLSMAVPAYLTTQSVQTQASGNIPRTGFTTTSVAGDQVAGTHDTAGLKLAVPAYLTTYVAQTVQTQASGAIPRSGFTTTATNGSVVVGTHDTDGLKLGVPPYLTTAQAPGAYLTTARGSTDALGLNTAQTNVTWTADSRGLSLDAGGYAGTGFTTTSIAGTAIAGTHNTAGLKLAVPAYLTAAAGGAAATLSFYEPFALERELTATSTAGVGTMHLQQVPSPNPISFNMLNVIGSASMKSTTAGNTVTFSNTGANSLRFSAQVSVTCDNYVDLYLFSRGTGGYSTDLVTLGSTRNTFRTIQAHTWDLSVTNGAGSTGSVTLNSSIGVTASFPAITSGTVTSVAANSTFTTWGMGYTTWTSSISTSASKSYNTTATASISATGTWPAMTAWSGAQPKLIALNFASSLNTGEYWLGFNRASFTSSSQSTAQSNVAAGKTYTSALNASNLTVTDQLMYVGNSQSIASSLGVMGQDTANSLAPSPGQGSFSATYDPASTYLNNNANQNGEIALSQMRTNAFFFQTWLQFASNRI